MEERNINVIALDFKVLQGPMRGHRFIVKAADQFTIGRAKENSLCVPEDRCVSRKHAVVCLRDEGKEMLLIDAGSKNGTFLNGKRIVRPKGFFQGDQIKIGETTIIFNGSKSG